MQRIICFIAISLLTLWVPFLSHAAEFVPPDKIVALADSEVRAGNYKSAIRSYWEALKIDRKNPETLRKLGMAYGYDKQFSNAISVLEKAHKLASQDSDVTVALGTVHSWQGDYPKALEYADTVLATLPANQDARMLKARVAYYNGELASARQQFSDIIVSNPQNAEAKEGLADTEKAAKTAEGYKWQLDAGMEHSSFSRQKQPDWQEESLSLSYRYTPALQFSGRIEQSHRFGTNDSFIQGGVNYRQGNESGVYIDIGSTPDADFRPEYSLTLGGDKRIYNGGGKGKWIGPSILLLDSGFDHYTNGNVKTLSPGITQYLGDKYWLTGHWINVWNSDNDYSTGWLAQGDMQVTDRFRFYLGAADAPETVAGVTTDTFTWFGGIAYDIRENLTLHGGYTHDDRENSYIREVGNVGVTYKF